MALLKLKKYQPVGVAFMIAPAWRQGYYIREGMTTPLFFDHPKQLANDTIWLTNAHFDVTKQYGNYIKNYRFLRAPINKFLAELKLQHKSIDEQVKEFYPFVQRLNTTAESDFLYHAENLISCFHQTLPKIETPEQAWQQLGIEARSWFWKGSMKHQLLTGGALYLPRFDLARQVIKCNLPDFSKPPKILKGEFKGQILYNLIKEHIGFVRVRIENVKNEIIEFIDLSRTLLTTVEVLWLMQYADITAKYLYLTTSLNHMADNPDYLEDNFKPYSWLDGIRLEALALSPGYKNIPMEAFLRGISHTAAAHYAWYLSKHNMASPINLSYGKIGIAYNSNEEKNIRKMSRKNGLFFIKTDDEGYDIHGKGL